MRQVTGSYNRPIADESAGTCPQERFPMGMQIAPTSRFLAACGLGLLMSVGLAPQASFAQGRQGDGAERGGQQGRGGFGQRGGQRRGGFGALGGANSGPYYAERDLPFFVEKLELDGPQRMVLEISLEDYLAAHQELSDAMAEQMQAMRPERTEEDQEQMRGAREDMRDVGREMRELQQNIRDLQQQAENGGDRDRIETMMTRLQSRMDDLREEMTAIRDTAFGANDWQSQMDNFMAVYEETTAERKALEAKFKADVQALLNDDQWAHWPAFEQFMRRQKTMGMGRLSGESVDLFNIVRDLRIDTEEAEREVQPLLEEYARQLDGALVARNEHLDRSSAQTRAIFQNQDIDTAMKNARQESSLRIRVRDTNRSFADLIAASMNDRELGAEFQQTFNEQAFGRIWRSTLTQRAIEQALEIEGLQTEVVEAIQSLQQAYMLELDTHNQGIQRLTVSEEPDDIVERIERMAARFSDDGGRGGGRFGRFGGGDEEDPVREAYSSRDEMDTMYRMMLEELLTPQQAASLPQPRQRGRGQGGQRGGQQRQQIMEQFDKDGDGELSEEERAAIREYFEQMRQQGGGEGRRGRGGGDNDDIA